MGILQQESDYSKIWTKMRTFHDTKQFVNITGGFASPSQMSSQLLVSLING
jgi:hypothetical protein